MKRHKHLAAIILFGCVTQLVVAQSGTEPAKQLFQKYITLENKFDPSMADLYAGDALIRNTRRYPNGQKRTIDIPAGKYKELIRTAMPLAKARGDRNRYSQVRYKPEGNNVRITAMRYSLLKKYSSPISLLVGPNSKGDWIVLEEISESIP
jgi:hypothetical protein